MVDPRRSAGAQTCRLVLDLAVQGSSFGVARSDCEGLQDVCFTIGMHAQIVSDSFGLLDHGSVASNKFQTYTLPYLAAGVACRDHVATMLNEGGEP